MLAKEVVQSYGDQVRFVSDDWGASRLADRFGVKRYPIVFVNDVMLARPNDFGWFGAKGRYTPWRDPSNHEKFKKDLARMIDFELRDDTTSARAASSANQEADLATLPTLQLQDLNGGTIDPEMLSGKVVIVEFWATWCLPCQATLPWLGELKRLYGGKIEIIAISVESEESSVRTLTQPMMLPYHVVLGSPDMATSFGDVTSVPTMFIFDSSGKTASVVYGAPKDLHGRVARTLNSLRIRK